MRDGGAATDPLFGWSLSGVGQGRLCADAPQRPCWGAAPEEGQRRAARTPRVSGLWGGWGRAKTLKMVSCPITTKITMLLTDLVSPIKLD